MKQKMKKVICMAVIGALALSGAVGDNVTSQAAAKTKKIFMNKKKVTLKVGKTFKLKVKKVKPAKASKAVTYKSKSKKIATVTKKGVIKGKKVGKTTITVTSKKNKKAKAKVTVTVKKADPNKPVTTPAPSNTPAASATPGATTTPVVSDTPATAVPPTMTAPVVTPPTKTKTPPTAKPPKTPTPVPTEEPWDGIDVPEYEFNVQKQLWTNEYYETKNNADGSVTLTRGKGEQDWQVGEFGFVIPRDVVGNRHQLTKIIIKFRDSDLTGAEADETTDTCGYVFHLGDKTNVGWIEGENQETDPDLPNAHPRTLLFNGAGETVITADENEKNFSTIRIFDGKIGGKITIEAVRLEKETITPPVESGSIESGTVESGTVESGSAEKAAGAEKSGTENPAPVSGYNLDAKKELWTNEYFLREALSGLKNLI